MRPHMQFSLQALDHCFVHLGDVGPPLAQARRIEADGLIAVPLVVSEADGVDLTAVATHVAGVGMRPRSRPA